MSVEVAERNLASRKKKRKTNTIRVVDQTPTKYTGSFHPTNLLQQKERFLKHGILPQFNLRASSSHVEMLSSKPTGRVSTTYLPQATRVLQLVKDKFKCGDEYLLQAFGERIDIKYASASLTHYLNEHSLDGQISIVWATDLDCSARMMWHGPNVKLNKPEDRKHTLIIRNSPDNFYLRREGIVCIAQHEIGTHYMRSLNDGLQPWYADRKMFGLRNLKSYEYKRTEEGLAALNTVLAARYKHLFGVALAYYTACKAESMTFKELFYHLEQYIRDPERRWHYVMRVKRHLPDPNDLGGLGKDQCYFEGAMDILLNIEHIDFSLLYSGALCLDELPRIKRLARMNCLKLPEFMSDIEAYKQQLRWLGYVNGILEKPLPRKVRLIKKSSSLPPTMRGPRENLYEPSRNGRRIQVRPEPSRMVPGSPSNMVLIHDKLPDAQGGGEVKSENNGHIDELKNVNIATRSPDMLLDEFNEEPIIRPINTDYQQNTGIKLGSLSSARPPGARSLTSTKPPVASSLLTAKTPGTSSCILEKLSSQLGYHDDLLKRVESKLSSAALSLKNTEKIVHGLKGAQGIITATPDDLRSESNYSFDLNSTHTQRDFGEFSVQSQPPRVPPPASEGGNWSARLSMRGSATRVPSGDSSLVEVEESHLSRQQKKVRQGVLLLRRNKSSVDGDFMQPYKYV